MARFSRQTRETIKTVVFLVVVIVLILVYVVYPLNRSKALMGREDIDSFKKDSLSFNDPNLFLSPNVQVDTFRIESDGVTKLALLYITPVAPPPGGTRGTVIIIPDERQVRGSLAALAKEYTDSGFVVITYDQRASGLSTGLFHSDGQLEAQDLEAVIAFFELRGRIPHPLVVLGFRSGGDAAMLAETDEKRIEGVVAVNPYLTTQRMLEGLTSQYGTYQFPFYRATLWWWFGMRSGYAVPSRDIENITPINASTRLYIESSRANDPELLKLTTISQAELLSTSAVTPDNRELVATVIQLARRK